MIVRHVTLDTDFIYVLEILSAILSKLVDLRSSVERGYIVLFADMAK